MAEVFFNRAAVLELMDDMSGAGDACSRVRDQRVNEFERCRQRYSRLHTEAEQKIRYASAALEAAESAVRAAQSRCAAAEQALSEAEDEHERESAMAQLQEAREDLAQAEADRKKALAALSKARKAMSDLTAAWGTQGVAGERALGQVEDTLYICHTLISNAKRDLSTFAATMEKARSALHGGGAGTGGSASVGGAAAAAGTAAALGGAGRIGLGWCARNSMQAVSVDENGTKSVSMRIGGKDITVPCTKSGMARAYREARRSGDKDLEARTAAMFEIETLREDLKLTAGEGAVQLGGYHRDVKGQDPAGYESHHIPSRSVQDTDADWMPALSISKDDHKETFSYAGRQRRVYQPILPSNTPKLTYQQEMSQEVGRGSSGYVAAVRNELYDLRVSTGHRYDGGISAYLDAVIDMLASRGLPGNK